MGPSEKSTPIHFLTTVQAENRLVIPKAIIILDDITKGDVVEVRIKKLKDCKPEAIHKNKKMLRDKLAMVKKK